MEEIILSLMQSKQEDELDINIHIYLDCNLYFCKRYLCPYTNLKPVKNIKIKSQNSMTRIDIAPVVYTCKYLFVKQVM